MPSLSSFPILWSVLLLVFVLTSAGPAKGAAPTVAWAKRFDNASMTNDYACGAALDSERNIIVGALMERTGAKYDYNLIKYRGTTGRILWSIRRKAPTGGTVRIHKVVVDGNDDVLVAGAIGETTTDIYVGKFSGADGATLWERRVDGKAQGSDEANQIAVDSAGNAFVAAYVATSDGLVTTETLKLSGQSGQVQWTSRYSKPAGSRVYPEGIVVGASYVYLAVAVVPTGASNDGAIQKLASANGSVLWTQTATNGSYADMALGSEGGIFLVGTTDTQDYRAEKRSSSTGKLLWGKTIPRSAGADYAVAAAVDANGDLFLGGQSVAANSLYDFSVAKFSGTNGDVLWQKLFAAASDDPLQDIALDNAGNVYATGGAVTADGESMLTVKFRNSTGAVLFHVTSDGTGNGAYGTQVLVDSMGGIFVNGNSFTQDDKSDLFTIKYTP